METYEPKKEPLLITKEKARIEIRMILQQVAVMGNNDYEFPYLNELLVKLEKDEIAPADAIEEAGKVLSRKERTH